MSIEWNGDNYLAELQNQLATNLEQAGAFLADQVKAELGKQGDSNPGEPPGRETGELQESVSHEMGEDKTVVSVGTNADYAAALELGTSKVAARPFLRPALANNADQIVKIIAGAAK